MADKNSKAKTKRLPKSQRKHIRRVKQAERKEHLVTTNPGGAAHS
jgi:hypothetical protein